MTKQKISSKVVRARTLAIYELEQFISYVRTIDPGLEPDQAIVLAAFVLSDLPQLFQGNPALLNRIRDIAASMKLKRRHPTEPKNQQISDRSTTSGM